MDHIARVLEILYLRADRFAGGRLSVLLRAVLAFDQDDGAVVSRSIAYYALFSLFPLLLVLMVIATSVAAVEEAQQLVFQAVEAYLPAAIPLLETNIEQLLEARSTVGILAGIGLLWSASGVFTAIYRAVNRAWGNPKSQLFWTEKLFGVAVVLVVGLLLLATTVFSTLASVLQDRQTWPSGWEPVTDMVMNWWRGWPSALLPAVISVITFTIFYRIIPRNRVRWRDVWVGGLLGGLIWEAARQIYAWYLANFARYSLIYGSVGAIIGFLLWAYVSAMILLLGAELTAQYTHWRRSGRTVESRPPRQWLNEWSKRDMEW